MPNTMQIQPYLIFEGRCDEAIAFYRSAVGAEVTMLMRFKDSPDPCMAPPGPQAKARHAGLGLGEPPGLASAARGRGPPGCRGVSLSRPAPGEPGAERPFGA